MKLIHKPTGQEIIEGTVLPDNSTVIYCPQPHKPSSEGKMQVGYHNGETSGLLYCSCFDCEWIDREDREEEPASLRVALPQASSSPVRTADQTTIEQIALMQKNLKKLQRQLNTIREICDDYVDGAEDASEVSKLANRIWEVL